MRRIRRRCLHPCPRCIQPVVRQAPALKCLMERQWQYPRSILAHRYVIHKPTVIHRCTVRHRPEPDPQIRLLLPFRQIHRMLRPAGPRTRCQPVDPGPSHPITGYFHIRIIPHPDIVPVPELQYRPRAPVQIHRRLCGTVTQIPVISARRIVQTNGSTMSTQSFPAPPRGKGPLLRPPFDRI